MSSSAISTYGFTPVLSSASALLKADIPLMAPAPISVADTPVPSTPLAQRVNAYARAHLPIATYNHSLRVYHYGIAIKRYRFPTWRFTDETFFLACLLHDIGTTEENLDATKMSFEFYGGFLALDILLSDDGPEKAKAPKEQAESVVEAIMRHQDLCQKGKITAVGQLLQLATIFDNVGLYSDVVHPKTTEDVTKHFPRLKWSNCFASTINRENQLKPWGHTSTLGEEEFPEMVLGNTLMALYE